MFATVQLVFPVYTGINRAVIRNQLVDFGVPCIHRDKPTTEAIETVANACSLYTQG